MKESEKLIRNKRERIRYKIEAWKIMEESGNLGAFVFSPKELEEDAKDDYYRELARVMNKELAEGSNGAIYGRS